MRFDYSIDDLPEILGTLSDTIRQYYRDNKSSLREEEYIYLKTLADTLLAQAFTVNAKSVELKLADSEDAFNKLKKLVEEADQTLETLNDVRNAIIITTAAVGLAGAIVSQNPVAIMQQAKNVYDVINKIES